MGKTNKPLPVFTCCNCGVTRSALHFNKLYGYYKKYKPTDPRRYDVQCKRCRKPRYPGQAWEEVKDVKVRSRSQSGRGNRKPKPKKEPLSVSERRKRARTRTRIRSMEYLAYSGCEECGERDPRVLEYDHKQPSDKKHLISRLILDGFGWSSKTLKREIRKCRVLCANCHRKHTIVQHDYYSEDDVQRALGILAAKHGFDL